MNKEKLALAAYLGEETAAYALGLEEERLLLGKWTAGLNRWGRKWVILGLSAALTKGLPLWSLRPRNISAYNLAPPRDQVALLNAWILEQTQEHVLAAQQSLTPYSRPTMVGDQGEVTWALVHDAAEHAIEAISEVGDHHAVASADLIRDALGLQELKLEKLTEENAISVLETGDRVVRRVVREALMPLVLGY